MRCVGKSPWAYMGYPNDTAAASFGSLASFVELWRRKYPSDNQFPRWKNFDPLDFEGWWGQVSLAEITHGPLDLRWVLWGTKITNWWGVDYTGKRISEMPNLRDVWGNYESHYIKKLTDDRLIGFVSGTLTPQDRRFTYICGVDLPLEHDGVITHMLSAYQLMKRDEIFNPKISPVFKI